MHPSSRSKSSLVVPALLTLFGGAAFAQQEAYIKASNTGPQDRFGSSVAMSGNTLVVGAPSESSSSTGIDGLQADENAPFSGAAYVYVRSGTTWTQQAYVKASNTGANDQFGSAVAIAGDTLVIGAPEEDGSGAIYVFVRSGTVWAQQAYLKASNAGAGDKFGAAVSVQGDTIVVGAWQEDSSATGVGGNEALNNASAAGAAYVFVRSGTVWTQQAYLKASNTDAGDNFGNSVSVFGDTLVAGALGEASAATGIDGNQASNASFAAGAAYVFTRSGTTWSQQAYVKASNTGSPDGFGKSVSLHGDTLAVSAFQEASAATGINGNQASNAAFASGAVYVFTRSGTTWSQEAYIKASNTTGVDRMGTSIALSGNVLVAGANGEDSNATGVNGDETNNLALDSGAAYVFTRVSGTWTQEAYLKASNTEQTDEFGIAVTAAGDTIVVGAYFEDSNTIGINQNQWDNNNTAAGAAYAFRVAVPPSTFCLGDGTQAPCPCGNNGALGRGCASSAYPGGAQLLAFGDAKISADTLTLFASDIPGPGLFFQSNGLAPSAVDFGDGHLCAAVGIIRLGVVFPLAGLASYPGGLTPNPIHIGGGPISLGDVRHYQCWYRSVPGLCGANNFDLTQGLSITWRL